MVLSSPSMTLRASIRRLPCFLQGAVAIGLVLLLLAIAPFAVAQDVHHELAAADHDGHEHSDTDLCQWVKHHTAGSLDVDVSHLTSANLSAIYWNSLSNPFFFRSIFLPSVLPAHLPASSHVICDCSPCSPGVVR